MRADRLLVATPGDPNLRWIDAAWKPVVTPDNPASQCGVASIAYAT